MSPSLLDFLRHILEEGEYILRATEDKSYEEFVDDETLRRAIVRSLEIIGEATKKLPPEFHQQHPTVDWRDMSRMRDRLIHHYFGVDYEIVYDTIVKNIPELCEELKRIITLH